MKVRNDAIRRQLDAIDKLEQIQDFKAISRLYSEIVVSASGGMLDAWLSEEQRLKAAKPAEGKNV